MNGLDIENLTVKFNNFELCATLGVPRGCITGLIGRNGAGKSTLIKAIMRQQDATGRILYNGMPFRGNEEEVLKKIACVYDAPHFNLFARASVIRNIYKGMYDFDAELFDELMERFALPPKEKVSAFSLGMQRKFCLILALCQRPEILLLDEPTAGIDPYDRGAVIELIQQFMLDEGHTVLFSTHITEDLDKIADHIAVMEKGRVILCEQKETLRDDYRLVSCSEMTEEMKRGAIGVRQSMFGYTFLTKEREIGGANVLVKTPTVEEIFVHLMEGEERK